MFFILSKILDLLLAPLTLVILLMATSAAIRQSRWRRLTALCALVLLYAFSVEPVANALTRLLEKSATATFHDDVTYDAVILMGGVVDERASPPPGVRSYNDNSERLLATYDLLRTDHARFAIASGGPVDPRRTDAIEANILVEQLVAWGIDPTRLVTENRARNTHENAVECARIVRERSWSRVLVVTSAFHMQRTHGCFRAEGVDVDLLPVDFRAYDSTLYNGSLLPRVRSFNQSSNALRELAGRVIYRLQGYSR